MILCTCPPCAFINQISLYERLKAISDPSGETAPSSASSVSTSGEPPKMEIVDRPPGPRVVEGQHSSSLVSSGNHAILQMSVPAGIGREWLSPVRMMRR